MMYRVRIMKRPLFLFLLLSLIAATESQAQKLEWPVYAADNAGTKYTPLNTITRDNVRQLQIAWRWRSVDASLLAADPSLWTWRNEATPLMIGGVLYTSTSLSQVAAIDAVTGQTRWWYDPESHRLGSPPNNGFLHRGVTYWAEGNDERIFIGTGDAHLIALDAESGNPITSFGTNGRVDLTLGLGRTVSRTFYGVTSPPTVCAGTVIVGSSIFDVPVVRSMPPGGSVIRCSSM